MQKILGLEAPMELTSEGKGVSTLSEKIPLKLVRRRRKKRKNQGRDAAVTLP